MEANGHTMNGHEVMSREQFLKAVDEIAHNVALTTRGRGWFPGFEGEQRDLDSECGYPPTGIPVGVDFFKELYEREPIAARVVEVLPRETWQATPRILDNKGDGQKPTEFEEAVAALGTALAPGGGPSWHKEVHGSPLWEHLLRLDVLSGIGQFGVMLLGLDDGKNLQDPVDGSTTLLTNSEGRQFEIPDSPMSDVDASRLNVLAAGPQPRQVWTHNDRKTREPQYREVAATPALNKQEMATLRRWHEQRQVYDAFERIRNQESAVEGDEDYVARWNTLNSRVAELVANVNPEGHNQYTGGHPPGHERVGRLAEGLSKGSYVESSLLHDKYDTITRKEALTHVQKVLAARGLTLEAKTGSSIVQSPRGGAKLGKATGYRVKELVTNKIAKSFADLLPGTDRQYYEAGSLGMGMARAKGASLQGTDQQYMGIQFGPSEVPADKPAKEGRKLLFVRCFDESLVQVVRWEWNVNNPRFGQPVMYRVTLNDPRQIYSGVGLPLATVFVHWTRIIHVACVDNKQYSEVLGTPRMQQCLNRLLDLRKVPAAGSEGYWQSCFAAVSLETNPQLGGDVKLDYKGLDQMMRDFKDGLTRHLITAGMTAKTIPPTVIDPTPHITAAIEAICIRIACPKRVFMGSERGELASSQDDDKWNDVLRAREQLHTTPGIVCPFFDRLILLGVLPEPEDGYRVEWPDRDSLNDKDKATLALTITQAIAAFIAGNCESLIPIKSFLYKFFDGFFSVEEIDQMSQEAEEKKESDIADKQAIADKHGFEPQPPEGFKNPEPEPPAPQPVKLKDGEKLVKPEPTTK